MKIFFACHLLQLLVFHVLTTCINFVSKLITLCLFKQQKLKNITVNNEVFVIRMVASTKICRGTLEGPKSHHFSISI